METILDYLRWRGDLTMGERPFNEVDNLIFAELAYFMFEDVLRPGEECLTLREAYRRYTRLTAAQPYISNDPIPLLAACAEAKRFATVAVTDYVTRLDKQQKCQFAAMTFLPPDAPAYVAFRGTDNTIVGWREDFNFSFMQQTPAQASAAAYLDRMLEKTDGPLYLGGHSKGGHLAVYAAAFCKSTKKERVLVIYSNDGPGFSAAVVEAPGYQAIQPKVRLIVPEASVVSILFHNKQEKEIVRSTATGGAHQHSPYTWMVERDRFARADKQSSSSLLLDETLEAWLDELTDTEKKDFVNAVFDALEASGATNLAELGENVPLSYNVILEALERQGPEAKAAVRDALKKLAQVNREVLWDETKKRFESLRMAKPAGFFGEK